MVKHKIYHRPPSRFSSIENFSERTYYKEKYYGEKYDKMFEKSRFEYIKRHINYKNKTLIDIGCNTGFFIFEALDNGAVKALGYEGSESAYLQLSNYVQKTHEKIAIRNDFFDLKKNNNEYYDIVHLLNVVHHLGNDYGEKASNNDIRKLKEEIISQVNNVSYFSKYLVFQMGFNLHGNVKYPLFEKGTKREMIDFIQNGVKQHWHIESIGVAQSDNGYVTYHELDNKNIERNDDLGEFLNRPIFILKSFL
ncbi:class I SAM-dependent methyltransferase [Halomonas sp. DWK9]|uniref:class I SAM-dependent methyltransferase n=1 Tax=Halomonas sp. DWK9 TaxID=3060155 RepID=UPI00287F55B0|nr:class I SAM-dependent methyltransferase [Halomonas sp. DWK9]